MTKFNTIAAATIAASLALAGTAAQADDITVNNKGLPTISVSLADLNLESEAGMKAAEDRLNRAAKRVCGDSNERVTLAERAQIRECVTIARTDATQSLAQRTQGYVVAFVDVSNSPR